MEYKSLADLIRPYIDKSSSDLPKKVRDELLANTYLAQEAGKRFLNISEYIFQLWDKLSPSERLEYSEHWDYESDPDLEAVREYFKTNWDKHHEVLQDIETSERLNDHGIPSESVIKNNILEELQIKRTEIIRIGNIPWADRKGYFDQSNPATSQTNTIPVRSMTKNAVINAFEGIYFDRNKWQKYLASPPAWLAECRVMRGSKSTSATWNPVLIAVVLKDRGIPLHKLDSVFVGLSKWTSEWQEASNCFRK